MPDKTNLLSPLVALSARIGADVRLVQGGGGNTSIKAGGDLWVKASGTWLAHVREPSSFVRMPLEELRTALRQEDGEQQLARFQSGMVLRPSIETSLHALLPHRVVVHVHSVNTIAWAVQRDAEPLLARPLVGLRWAWVPYRRPGFPLTQAVIQTLSEQVSPPDVLVLGNHGLVVGAPDCPAAEALLADVERRLTRAVRPEPAWDRTRLQAANDLQWRIPENAALHTIGTDCVTLKVARSGALYPDHVVFLGPQAAVCDSGRSLSQAVSDVSTAGAAGAVYCVVPGAGILVSPTIAPGAEAILECLTLVGLRLSGTEDLRYLNDSEVAALMNWEAEAYRRSHDRFSPSA